jgi:hypothetical protein
MKSSPVRAIACRACAEFYTIRLSDLVTTTQVDALVAATRLSWLCVHPDPSDRNAARWSPSLHCSNLVRSLQASQSASAKREKALQQLLMELWCVHSRVYCGRSDALAVLDRVLWALTGVTLVVPGLLIQLPKSVDILSSPASIMVSWLLHPDGCERNLVSFVYGSSYTPQLSGQCPLLTSVVSAYR